eukprot:9353801-Lingulodinium_polyedra.AAC.1
MVSQKPGVCRPVLGIPDRMRAYRYTRVRGSCAARGQWQAESRRGARACGVRHSTLGVDACVQC